MRVAMVVLCLLGVSPTSAGDCSRPIAGGLSWWPGDASAIDLLGPNHGTAVGGVAHVPGRVASAFSFDGADDHVAIPFHTSYDFVQSGVFTIAVWVNVAADAVPRDQALVVKSPPGGTWDWGLSLAPDNRFTAGGNGRTAVTSRTVAVPGVWYHVAVTYMDSLWHLYVNGTREATATGILISRSTGGLALARKGEATQTGDLFRGLLDEAEIFTRALTRCSIAALADTGPAGQCKADDDADGISDIVDNCLRLSNPVQTDGDSDGAGDACDCAPADPATFAIPLEVRRLEVGTTGKDVVTWCPASMTGGTSSLHQLVRGSVDELPVGSGVSETCLVSGSTSSTYTDPSLPVPGESFWYLVRGRNACGTGSYGFEGTHGAAGAERVTGVCP